MKKLIISSIIFTFSSVSVYTQNDPFVRPNSGNPEAQIIDPFATSTNISKDPFAEIDPLSPVEKFEDNSEFYTEYVDELPTEKKRAVIVIEGANGLGTGFVATINGILFIITNAHVIKGNENLEFMTMDGIKLNISDVYTAVGYDVVILRIVEQDYAYFFKVTSDVFSTVSVGTEILIPGNSMGDGTILQTNGEIISIGPKLIEHDAPTFSGNSGSPIINKENWEVIGVDTFSRKRDLLEWFNQYSKEQNESQIKNEVRLFGYRLDNIPKWEKILFTKLYRQNNDIIEIQTETLSVFSAIMGSDWHYQRSDTVSRIRNRFYKRMVGNIAFQDQVRYKQLARSALYTHLNSMQKRAEANIQNAYAIMRQDYFKTIALCKAVKEFVGRYYESDSSVDPFETRNQI